MALRWSEEDYERYLNKSLPPKTVKKGKYHSKKITIDGIVFDSEKEGRYYETLKLMKRAGIVIKFECQPKFILITGKRNKNGKKNQAITYSPDFKVFYEDGHVEIVDVKSAKDFKTEVYRIKKKLFEYFYPCMTIKEIYTS